ncbi:MAG: hypothetical protein PHP86_18370 [Nevskiales bacterium]|nr:hypothetical protein [Nevskiales bacterium]
MTERITRGLTPALVALACGGALAAMPGMAAAQNYGYIEGGYLNRDSDRIDDAGLRIAGSGPVAGSVALIGEYADTGDDEQFSGGVLLHGPLSPELDWTAGATLEFADNGHDDDQGYGLRGGLRWRFAEYFELNPEIRHTEIFDHGETALRLAGLVRIAPRVDLQAALQGGDEDRLEVGARYNF